MREELEKKSMQELREIGKKYQISRISALRKTELINQIVERMEQEEAAKAENPEKIVKSEPEKRIETVPARNENSRPFNRETAYRSGNSTAGGPQNRPYRTVYSSFAGGANPNTGSRPNRDDNNRRTYRNTNEETRSAASESTQRPQNTVVQSEAAGELNQEAASLDSGVKANGILEVMADGFGFIRCENYLPGENDIYVSPSQIRRFNLKTGDMIQGNIRIKTAAEKFSALLYVTSVNGISPDEAAKRRPFEMMTPIFPNRRMYLERPDGTMAMRIVDLISPIGRGQRGLIVSPPKAGKTTLLKDVAKSIQKNNEDMHLIILLIDERPEEVTDIREAIEGPDVEVIYSTFDELPDHHRRVSEMVIERARRLVEHHKNVTILLDSITRLARAYNMTVPPSGRTLSGGLDPAALHMPKRFFGAARNMREGGSLTILATALVDTGSKMDDVIYEEFKGTGNMELILDRKLQERRVFPAIDIQKSGTRREDLLLTKDEYDVVNHMRRSLNGVKPDEAAEVILNLFSQTSGNADLLRRYRIKYMAPKTN